MGGRHRLRDMARRLAAVTEIPPVAAPSGLKATLRPYQEDGLAWLQFLSSCGLSGVLADDMGLGKTLQALAHILAEKEAGRLHRPCLVVAPTSLIPTWRNEARKFAPALRVLVLHGNERRELFDEIAKHDIVLTSYALLLRDRELLLGHNYSLAILDEAQAIKNPTTKLARTACQIKADHRLALTGTPMENHLGELWSVFNFLMPGFLGDRETFRRVFRNPIEKDGDAARQQLLGCPHPPVPAPPHQGAGGLRAAAQDRDPARDRAHRGPARPLRERPPLHAPARARGDREPRASPAATSPSSKRSSSSARSAATRACSRAAATTPRSRQVRASDGHAARAWSRTGRRMIVFSQFVEMLDLIDAGPPQAENSPSSSSPARPRTARRPSPASRPARSRSSSSSLKAGGTGLNLTAADTVIHYDPWWNPAVEAQATDRAHRIGQDKTVFVYKLIAAGTVEERMVELQAKNALAEGVLGQASAERAAFGEDDLQALFQPLR